MSSTSLAIGVIVGLLLYGLVLLVIDKKATAKTQGKTSEFYAAGRSMPWFVMLGTFMLSLWSAGSLYGNTAALYRLGIGYISGCSGNYFLGMIAPCIIYPMWLLGKKFGFCSPTGIISYRYGSRTLTYICGFVFLLCAIPLISANVTAFAYAVSQTTAGKVSFGIAAAFMIFYVFGHIFRGGSNSVCYADCFAGILSTIGLIVITILLIVKVVMPVGGLSAAADLIRTENPDLLIHSGAFSKGFQTAGIAISASMSSFIWPHVLVRSFMAKDVKTFRMQAILLPPLIWLTYALFSFHGTFIGHVAFPGLSAAASEHIMPMMMVAFMPLVVCVWYVLCVFAYGLSTADSLAVSCSSVVQIDMLESREEIADKRKLYTGIILIAIGVSLVVIFRPPFVVTYMYSFCNPGFFAMAPAMIGGMFWKRATKAGAFASTIAGFATVCYVLFVHNPIPSMNPILWGTAASLPVFVVVSLLTKQNDKEAHAASCMCDYMAETFKGRNNGTFFVLLIISICLFIWDMYLIPRIGDASSAVFGWMPLQVFLHLCTALCMAVVGIYCCRNRFGLLPTKKVKSAAVIEQS